MQRFNGQSCSTMGIQVSAYANSQCNEYAGASTSRKTIGQLPTVSLLSDLARLDTISYQASVPQ